MCVCDHVSSIFSPQHIPSMCCAWMCAMWSHVSLQRILWSHSYRISHDLHAKWGRSRFDEYDPKIPAMVNGNSDRFSRKSINGFPLWSLFFSHLLHSSLWLGSGPAYQMLRASSVLYLKFFGMCTSACTTFCGIVFYCESRELQLKHYRAPVWLENKSVRRAAKFKRGGRWGGVDQRPCMRGRGRGRKQLPRGGLKPPGDKGFVVWHPWKLKLTASKPQHSFSFLSRSRTTSRGESLSAYLSAERGQPEESELWRRWVRYCLHMHANSHKHTTHTHTDNNVVQTICHSWDANFHSGHVRAWPHSFSCLCQNKCHFCGASSLRMEICNFARWRFSFTKKMRGYLLTLCSNYTALLRVHSFYVLDFRLTGPRLSNKNSTHGCADPVQFQPGWRCEVSCCVKKTLSVDITALSYFKSSSLWAIVFMITVLVYFQMKMEFAVLTLQCNLPVIY